MMAGDRIHHPRPAELERFLLGELSATEAARVVAHLLTGCADCRLAMEPLAAVVLSPDLAPEPSSTAAASEYPEYDFPLFRAFAAARRYAASRAGERTEAERDREDLPLREVPLPQPLDERARGARDWQRSEQMIARCLELRRHGPEAMVAAASLAVGLAQGISPEVAGPFALADLQARAWAERGNARRIADDLPGAEADFARALQSIAEGTGDPRLLARLMDLTASLRTDQRRFVEALQLLDWVYGIHCELGESHEAGRALISKSNAAAYALDAGEAVRLLGQGLALIDADREPGLALATVHNLLSHLVDSGQVPEAWRVFRESRDLYAAYGGPIERLKARWLEGRIELGLGRSDQAERAFLDVRGGFEQSDLPYDMALVALDLSALWLEQGRNREIQALLDETVTVFQARGIRREAIAALLMLREAFERERATAALLRTVAAELQRLENQPVRRVG
jgi:tetratricopeptide (TPR) repeat protein